MFSFFYFLLFFQPVFGGHFDGGTIQWVPISKNASASPVQILITQSYSYTLSLVNCTVGLILENPGYASDFNLSCISNCGATSAGYVPLTVLGYCTGFNTALNLASVQRSDIVNLTANDHFTIAFGIANNDTSGFYRALTLSNGTSFTTAHWNISATIDIRPRADNGLINTPPSATVMSPYGIPYNVTTQIVIPTMDVNGDNVRCRWGNSSSECGSVCYPLTTPTGTTLSSNCTLTITGTSVGAWYCASIQVEDFLNTSTSLAPMSSTSIQFLIYVYQPQNCSAPLLTSPSTCVGVQVGLPTTVTLTVINSCGSSSNISSIALQSFSGIVQGLLVLITPNGTVYAMNITYTPLASQVGLQILCATALDSTNIPSNQYCITFNVGSTSVPTCGSTTTTTTTTTTRTSTTTTTTRTSTTTTTTQTSTTTTTTRTSTTTTTTRTSTTTTTTRTSTTTTTTQTTTTTTTTRTSTTTTTTRTSTTTTTTRTSTTTTTTRTSTTTTTTRTSTTTTTTKTSTTTTTTRTTTTTTTTTITTTQTSTQTQTISTGTVISASSISSITIQTDTTSEIDDVQTSSSATSTMHADPASVGETSTMFDAQSSPYAETISLGATTDSLTFDETVQISETSTMYTDSTSVSETSTMFDDQSSPYTETISLGAMTDSLTSVETVQISETSTIYGVEISTYVVLTSIEIETMSATATQILQTTANETSKPEVVSTTTASKSKTLTWALIGTLIGLLSLLALLASCCACYQFLLSHNARRRLRQQQQQEKQHRFQHRSASETTTDQTRISRPSKPYRVFNVDMNSGTSPSAKTGSTQVKRLKRSTVTTSSSVSSRFVSENNSNDSKKATYNSLSTNRAKNTITVTRAFNAERR